MTRDIDPPIETSFVKLTVTAKSSTFVIGSGNMGYQEIGVYACVAGYTGMDCETSRFISIVLIKKKQ